MDIHLKPEENERFIRIPVAEGLDSKLRTISIDKSKGITALYAVNRKVILTYIFDKEVYPWTMEKARKWIKDHKEAKQMNEDILLVTQKLKLSDVSPIAAKEIAKEHGIKEDDITLVRKGITPADLKFEEGERAIISYITTAAVDRDGEIVMPSGAQLREYKKNPVVLFGHNYHNLPIGKNEWIKRDDKGLIAKTIYAEHEEAEKVYQYRKSGFPMAESIGFVPLEYKDLDSEEEREKNGGARRIYTKWMLLEYSDVPVPSNPEALQIAIAKGLANPVLCDEEKEIIEEISKEKHDDIDESVSDNLQKEGRVLSTKNRKIVKEAISALQALLDITEPREEGLDDIPEIKDVQELENTTEPNPVLEEISKELRVIIEKLNK